MKNFFISFKNGFTDLNTVLSEGKAKILLRPIVIILLAVGAAWYFNGKIILEHNAAQKNINALKNQKNKITGYPALKEELISLEKDFPDVKYKTEWLYGLVIDVFTSQKLSYDFTGSQKEASNDLFIVTTLGVRFTTSYAKLGELVAAIENSGKFVRISDVKFTKNEAAPGIISVEMNLSTAFLQEQSFPADKV